MSSMLLAASVGTKFNRATLDQRAGKNLSAGQTWILDPGFLALRSTTDRIIVSSDASRPRFQAMPDVGWRICRFAYNSVTLQYGDGSADDSKDGTYLFILREELIANGTRSDDQEDDFGDGLYRVISASGQTLGHFDNLALASAALRHWAQAVAVVCGSRVIERKGEQTESRAA